ncbi:MAG TPA: branched-chain amino acid ABC transporter substrate-binding protein [Actinomycetota bacterium]|nr:branched-chain amino acid ABC transporter substrate-binding protein [Actinomycetota bacterium]
MVAAACSNSSNNNASGGGGGNAADCNADQFGCVTYKSGEPIKLGTLLAISGDTASLGLDSQHGVALAIDYLDGSFDGTGGQIDGHDITLVNEDDGCSAEGGQAGATKLAADPQIVGVIGTSCSSAALGVADKITSDKGIVMISPSNTNPNLTAEGTHQPFYLRTAHNDKIQGAIVADFAIQKLGAKTAATIHDESPYADALAAVFRDNFQQQGGTIVPNGDQAVQSTDTDLKPLLTSIGQDKPDVLYFPDFNPVCALISKQSAGVSGLENTALIGSDGCLATDYLKIAGSAADGDYASSPDLSVFANGDFYKNQFIPAYKDQFGGAPTSVFHAHAFDAANILFEAIKKVAVQGSDGSLQIPRTALKDAVFATSGYQGMTGTITCVPLGDCATDVTIAVFKAPDWPVEGGNPDAKPVFTETKTLQDVS